MAVSRSLTILFRPGMMPEERFAIEDELEDALGEVAELCGGGTMVDLSMSDIHLETADFSTALPMIREVLQRLKVPETTVILELEPKRIEHPVYP